MRSKMYNQFACSSFMLPEHVEALGDYHEEEHRREAEYMPEFDEQELEIWEYLIRQSLQKGCRVSVTYLDGSERKPITGVAVEAGNGVLRVRDSDTGKIKAINLDKTCAVEEG